MSYRYYAEECSLPQIVGASQTDLAISSTFPISHAGSLNLLVALQFSGVTAGAGITAKLQSSATEENWLDANSVSVTANGWFYIRINIQVSADQAKLPLCNLGRIVLTTGAGSAATVDAIYIQQGR